MTLSGSVGVCSSKSCQRLDWKKGAHKIWCGAAGEVNIDFEVRAVPGKGLGLFAMRPFKRFDVIMVEDPSSQSSLPASALCQRRSVQRWRRCTQ